MIKYTGLEVQIYMDIVWWTVDIDRQRIMHIRLIQGRNEAQKKYTSFIHSFSKQVFKGGDFSSLTVEGNLDIKIMAGRFHTPYELKCMSLIIIAFNDMEIM